MDAGSKRAFLFLVIAQALHSLEEFHFELWESLPVARYLSGLVSADLPTGFAVLNGAIVTFGFCVYLFAVRRSHVSAVPLAWFWTIVEMANGGGHLLFALRAGGYFPGALTAPLLLATAAYLAMRLQRGHAAR